MRRPYIIYDRIYYQMSTTDLDRKAPAPTVGCPQPTDEEAPCLPGFEAVRATTPVDALPMADGDMTSDGQIPPRHSPKDMFRSKTPPAAAPGTAGWKIVLTAVLTLVLSVAGTTVYMRSHPRTIVRETVREVAVEPDGLPLDLLPASADASLWPVVANMSGTIDGARLTFRRGLARNDGVVYKVCLDFCCSGTNIYARVTGRSTWVVMLDLEGNIVRTYRSPKSNKPLKDIFTN